MFRRLVLPASLISVVLAPAIAFGGADPGSLDGSFSGDGKALVDFGSVYETEVANDVIVRGNGKVVLAGQLVGDTENRWAVARLREDGRPDRSFSGNGRAVTPLGSDDGAYAVLPRSSGRILVGGTSDGLFALVAYTASGGLDTSWGGDGIVTTPIPAGPGTIRHLRRLDDGAVLAAGPAGGHAVVARYLSDGTLDDTYGDGGIVTAPEFAGTPLRVRVEPDGAILATGVSELDTVMGIRTERYDAEGDPLTSFGDEGGVTFFYPDAESGRGQVVLRQPDGKTLVAGSVFGEGDYRYHVVLRYLDDGSLDPSFGSQTDSLDGVVKGLFDCCYAEIMDMQLQSDGKIVVAGWTDGEPPIGFLVGRYKPSGQPDNAFGARNGFRAVGLTKHSQARAVTIGGGRILVAGWSGITDGSAAFAVARLHK